jgi:membrane associated rhomboid family serine protease
MPKRESLLSGVFIPLSTDLSLTRKPIVTRTIIGLAVAMHLFMVALARVNPEMASAVLRFGQIQGGSGFHWWGLFTAAFLHGGWIHLLGNMVFLWVFGPSVENRFGRVGFLAFYLGGAAISGGAHALIEPMPAIGASGAIAAVTGAFIVLFPQTKIRCLWLFGLTIIHAPAWWVIGLGIIWNLLAAGFGMDRGVANIAHLGGYVFGIGLTMLLLWTHIFPREPYDLFTALRQAKRRRELRSATATIRGPTRPEQAVSAPPDERTEAMAQARAEVSRFMAEPDLDQAAQAYRRMLERYGDAPRALLTLPRNMQYELATWLYGQGRHAEAADAFARLLEVYPKDDEGDQIRLLLARAYSHRLDRPREAAALLDLVIESGSDDQTRMLAERARAALGN